MYLVAEDLKRPERSAERSENLPDVRSQSIGLGPPTSPDLRSRKTNEGSKIVIDFIIQLVWIHTNPGNDQHCDNKNLLLQVN